MRPGTASTVLMTKNCTQSTRSAIQPLEEERNVRPNDMKEESSAYWVAV